MSRTRDYRGFVSFATTAEEFNLFKTKINRYYAWCGALGLDPAFDENYENFCEGEQVV